MKSKKDIRQCLSFDDVLIVPRKSEVLPSDVRVQTMLSKNIRLNIPLLSSAMDTVTDSRMAVAMAMEGGLGVIHRNFPPEIQAEQVRAVKHFAAQEENLKNAALDANGSLLVAAAIGTSENDLYRLEALMQAGVDTIVLDTAHGHSYKVMNMIANVKSMIGDIALIVGNIATAEAAEDLVDCGVDAIKVGIGPGSICTTRIIAGIGVPQLTAILDVAAVCKKYNIPLIADGGIKNSGDVAKAIAAGADAVMIGSLFAGTDESPGAIIEIEGKNYKEYRGMGSISAMAAGSHERYFQDAAKKFVPEGVEGYILYKGSVKDIIYQLVGGLKTAMGYTGNGDIVSMRENCDFIMITGAGLRESHVHDLNFVKNAPNYNGDL